MKWYTCSIRIYTHCTWFSCHRIKPVSFKYNAVKLLNNNTNKKKRNPHWFHSDCSVKSSHKVALVPISLKSNVCVLFCCFFFTLMLLVRFTRFSTVIILRVCMFKNNNICRIYFLKSGLLWIVVLWRFPQTLCIWASCDQTPSSRFWSVILHQWSCVVFGVIVYT